MEKIERQSTSEELLEQYDTKFSDKQEITLDDLAEMKNRGVSTEMFLDYLIKKHNCLLHGSRDRIPLEEGIVSSGREKIYATNDASVAIIKAIFSAKGLRNLGYHLGRSGQQKVTIEGNATQDTIGERGYIYVVGDAEGFSNEETQGQTEFIKVAKKGDAIPYSKSIEIEKKDFKYPVEFIK